MKKLPYLVVGVLIVAAGASLAFFWPFSGSHRELQVPGTVEIFEVRLGSKVGGRVAEVLIREGDTVEKGTELVRFEAPELRAQREQLQAKLAGAKADLEKANNGPRPQEIDEAKAQFESAKAKNERMQKGWRDEEKDQAKHDLETAAAERELAQENWRRMQITTRHYNRGGR